MTKQSHDNHKINNGNLVIRTIDKSNDSPTKSANLADKLNDDTTKLEQITTHMVDMMNDEG